jgi:Ca2+-binding EF-hand superfamily protein
LRDLNKVAFEFYDCDHDGDVTILELIKLSTLFDDTSDIGREINILVMMYQNTNVRPKYVKDRQKIDFEKFNEMIPESCIIREL